MATDTMAVAALGRPFTLGMLYDSRQDRLIPGFTLWDDKALEENTVDSFQRSSAFEIIASDTIEDKSSLLNVEASLKASFLSGLVEVGGSAKYLTDTKKFENQSRVTLQYKATTKFKQLSMAHLATEKMQYTDVFEKGLATHVVSGILYGANAFFVFDSNKSESSSVQDIQGSMEVIIKKIPTVEIGGQASFQMTDEEKAMTKNFSCKFHGDFHLESNPTTFEDALTTYQQLPKLLGGSGDNAVPLKVWLMPLKNLDSKAAQLFNDISIGLVRKAQDALEDMSELTMRCNDSLEDKVVKQFPQIYKKMSNFKNMCNDYTFNIRQTLAKKLPSIRGGEEDESALANFFDERHTSPFSNKNLNKWMDAAEREISIVRSCVDRMEGTKTKIVKTRRELDREVYAPQLEHAICFVFTSLEGDDPYLKVLADYLNSPKSGSIQDVKPATPDQWCFSNEVFAKMRGKAEAFRDFARAMKSNNYVSFLVAALANEKYKGASIYHYREGSLVTDDFSRPEIPSVETLKDKTDLHWYAFDLTMDPNTANRYLQLSEGNKKATFDTKIQSFPANKERFDSFRQVMCKEALTGRCYWEVEWTGFISIGVTDRGISRTGVRDSCVLGIYESSWSLSYTNIKSELFRTYHAGKETSAFPPPSDSKRVGVYLDWPAGTLSFYQISSDNLIHLHTFRHRFTQALHAAFLVTIQSCYVSLSHID
ncbi:neoverrucotoxin subunit beta-like [Centroberyx affinis]|uniref:neoverrucotoxin subunit beta-like n=1 Tax=Centroberyx affinis TaxID=166261 RepID=UPI003A5BA770